MTDKFKAKIEEKQDAIIGESFLELCNDAGRILRLVPELKEWWAVNGDSAFTWKSGTREAIWDESAIPEDIHLSAQTLLKQFFIDLQWWSSRFSPSGPGGPIVVTTEGIKWTR